MATEKLDRNARNLKPAAGEMSLKSDYFCRCHTSREINMWPKSAEGHDD